MATGSDAAAERRLRTLLANEDYGPKLARLNRAEESRVLELISENRGKEARAAIDKADRNRRKGRQVRERARDYARQSKAQRKAGRQDVLDEIQDADDEVLWDSVFWRAYDKAGAH